MRDETRKKLDGLVARDRNALIAVVLATLVACAGYLAWTLPFGPAREASGRVRNRWTLTEGGKQKVELRLEVLLDDGRYAVATSTFRNLPDIGSLVLLRDETNMVGYHHYYWDGLVPAPSKPTP